MPGHTLKQSRVDIPDRLVEATDSFIDVTPFASRLDCFFRCLLTDGHVEVAWIIPNLLCRDT